LPPRGSAQDKIIEEVHRRERLERFTLVTLFAQILGEGMGMRDGALATMLNGYWETLSQLRYTPEYAEITRQRLRQTTVHRDKKAVSDATLLKKLEGLTSPDEKTPSKRGSRRR